MEISPKKFKKIILFSLLECGVGKYYPIRYNQNGSVAEEMERIELEEQPGRSADK